MKVLIIDDEYEILQEIKELVEGVALFQLVGCYTNPVLALEEAKQLEAELAFVDIQMPGINGLDLAEALQQINPAMEIIFITAFNQYAVQAFEVGAIDYILKPVHPQRFEKAVSRVLAGYEKEQPCITPKIQIRSFGHPELLLDDVPAKWNRSKSKEVFFYLLCHGNIRKNKYVICEELWPESDPQKALVNLQTAICGLRKTLNHLGAGQIVIEYFDDCYGMRIGTIPWDYTAFRQFCSQEEYQDLEYQFITELYSGGFLEGEDWNWAVPLRSQTEAVFMEKAERIVDYYMLQHAWKKAIQFGQLILKEQPFNGKIQRCMGESVEMEYGISALTSYFLEMRSQYMAEYNLDLDSRVYAYLREKNIVIF